MITDETNCDDKLIDYELLMYQCKLGEKIKENNHVSITLVEYAGKACVLKRYFNRNLVEVYSYIKKIRQCNITTIYEAIYYEGDTYVVEERLAGENLSQYLKRKGKLSEDETVQIIKKLCQGLILFHNHKPPLVHRDIKPSNIMLLDDGNVKLIDFDITRIYRGDKKKDTQLLGTEEYAAPEQLGGFETGTYTDIYSIGITMHEMLTGNLPEKKGTMLICSYHGSLEKIIKKCLEFNPNRRYKSAEKLSNVFQKNKKIKKLKQNAIIIFIVLLLGALFGVTRWQGEIAELKRVDTQSIPVSDSFEKEIFEIGKPDGTVKSMIGGKDGLYYTTFDRDNQIIIEISNGKKINVSEMLNEQFTYYGVDYNPYKNEMYFVGYQKENNWFKIYQITRKNDLILLLEGETDFPLELYSFFPSSYFSDGTMLCIMAGNAVIDTENWSIIRNIDGEFTIGNKVYTVLNGAIIKLTKDGQMIGPILEEDEISPDLKYNWVNHFFRGIATT